MMFLSDENRMTPFRKDIISHSFNPKTKSVDMIISMFK